MTFWQTWHEDYEDPNSDLSHRLEAVQDRLRAAIEEAPPGPIRLISACAGEGRDVAGALENHARARDVRGVLVELDGELAARAQRNVQRSGLDGIQIRQADAGYSGAYEGAVPADVLLLCGIFGNVSPTDVRNTVIRSKMLCAPEATVIVDSTSSNTGSVTDRSAVGPRRGFHRDRIRLARSVISSPSALSAW